MFLRTTEALAIHVWEDILGAEYRNKASDLGLRIVPSRAWQGYWRRVFAPQFALGQSQESDGPTQTGLGLMEVS